MRWEIEIAPKNGQPDLEARRIEAAIRNACAGFAHVVQRSARLYLLQGELDRHGAQRLSAELLTDSTVEACVVHGVGHIPEGLAASILLKPGVMDPVAESVLQASADLGMNLESVRTARRY